MWNWPRQLKCQTVRKRYCAACHQVKPIGEFSPPRPDSNGNTQRPTRCKPCERDESNEQRRGLTKRRNIDRTRATLDIAKLVEKGGLPAESALETLNGFMDAVCGGSPHRMGVLFGSDFNMVRDGKVICPHCKGEVKVPRCKPSELKQWWGLVHDFREKAEQVNPGMLPTNEDDLRAALLQVFWELLPNDEHLQRKAAEMLYRIDPSVLEDVIGDDAEDEADELGEPDGEAS